MIKLRIKLRQKYIDWLGKRLRKRNFEDTKLQTKMYALIDKQMADRALLKIQELPHGGRVFWEN